MSKLLGIAFLGLLISPNGWSKSDTLWQWNRWLFRDQSFIELGWLSQEAPWLRDLYLNYSWKPTGLWTLIGGLRLFDITKIAIRIDRIFEPNTQMVPAGNLTQLWKNHHAITGKIHYFEWAFFHSYVSHCQMVYGWYKVDIKLICGQYMFNIWSIYGSYGIYHNQGCPIHLDSVEPSKASDCKGFSWHCGDVTPSEVFLGLWRLWVMGHRHWTRSPPKTGNRSFWCNHWISLREHLRENRGFDMFLPWNIWGFLWFPLHFPVSQSSDSSLRPSTFGPLDRPSWSSGSINTYQHVVNR